MSASMPRATIRDVATLCGVTPSTVSRAFSTPTLVNVHTMARIQNAAAELNYVPGSRAAALRSGRTETVGVLVSDSTNPFYFALIRGIQLQLKSAGRMHMLVDTEESDEVEANAIQQLHKIVDGVIIAASRLSDEALLAAAAAIPVVAVNRHVPGVAAVLIDTPSAAVPVLDHLVSLGHSQIAYLSGPEWSQSNARRWAMLAAAARDRGVRIQKLGPFAPKSQSGAAAADAAVNSGATACVVFNDLIAIGMLQRLRDRGVQVPQDMSIVGCDDIFGADFCQPPLTTVSSPIEQAGRMAVALLLTQQSQSISIANPNPWVMPTYLTVRSSTAVARDTRRSQTEGDKPSAQKGEVDRP